MKRNLLLLVAFLLVSVQGFSQFGIKAGLNFDTMGDINLGNIEKGSIVINNDDERSLALKLAQIENIVFRAHNDKEPSIIADYAYTLAQTFSGFYNACPIMNAEDEKIVKSRLSLAYMVKEALTLMLFLLGIEAPEVMLKAS